jgi:hypothetical protein
MSYRGLANRRRSPISATSASAATSATPRNAWSVRLRDLLGGFDHQQRAG